MIEIPTLVDRQTFNEIFNMISERLKNKYIRNQESVVSELSVVVEVGSFVGGSICYLGQKIKESNILCRMFAVDNWDFDNIGPDHKPMIDTNKSNIRNFIDNITRCGLEELICPCSGDSINESKTFSNEFIDFIYLDGNHDRDYVYNELEAWFPKMKENSFISGHDYNDPGVRDSVNRFFAERGLEVKQFGESYLVQLGTGI